MPTLHHLQEVLKSCLDAVVVPRKEEVQEFLSRVCPVPGGGSSRSKCMRVQKRPANKDGRSLVLAAPFFGFNTF